MIWIYLSGPLSSDPSSNVHRACYAWRRLQDKYRGKAVFICPHWSQLQDMVYPMPYGHWIQYDLDLLSAMPVETGIVYRMRGESSGADREVEFASALGIEVVQTEHDLRAAIERRLSGTADAETGQDPSGDEVRPDTGTPQEPSRCSRPCKGCSCTKP